MTPLHDALVIGGGPAGATTAFLLARAGWSVALLERKAFPRRKVCGEYLSASNLPLLERLGLAGEFRDCAGPPVRRVGFFAGSSILCAPLPQLLDPRLEPGNEENNNSSFSGSSLETKRKQYWGRALSREVLDTLLLNQAVAQGVEVQQPCSALEFRREGEHFICRAERQPKGECLELHARIIIAAHGSWESGSLSTQLERPPQKPGDLLGFKAHFRHSDLPSDLMPLLAFPGGYGGMVNCEGGRTSLSLCIRRDQLTRLRQSGGQSAGETVLHHIMENCRGVKLVLAGAEREGDWLATGPIRPGIRVSRQAGVFLVGNAAGEAHPVVAEGISMAMQAGWLLANRLIPWKNQGGETNKLAQIGMDYAKAWRRSFAPRLFAASMIAHWAMHPATVSLSTPLLRFFPNLLSLGARLSGKVTRVS